LAAAAQFKELVGDRRLLRFLRGHKHDVDKAAEKYAKMLEWRAENGVDKIREDIRLNKKFTPRYTLQLL
jgi:hypothetical protein